MPDYAEFEIGLQYYDEEHYAVETRFTDPGNNVDKRLPGIHKVRFDLNKLGSLTSRPQKYGEVLTESLFADSDVLAEFASAWGSVQKNETAALRLRLVIGSRVPELHNLVWETLNNPIDKSSIGGSQRILFSRYLSSFDWRPVKPRKKEEMRALVAIADPDDMDGYPLAQVQGGEELKRAQASLAPIPVTALRKATLKGIINCLQDGSFDILYLVAHGMLIDGSKPFIFLCDEDGKIVRTPGSNLADRMREIQQVPRLVVLASCQSSGVAEVNIRNDQADDQDEFQQGALSALGPRLAEAGVPAVLAMQGNITMQTVEKFMPVFFQQLQLDGQIDRAVAAARAAVSFEQRPDYWMPALFMRLTNGRIWYIPGFASKEPDEIIMKNIIDHISERRCTPILGPGMTEPLLGSHRDIAERWAAKYQYPMFPHGRESLPQVAQYLEYLEYLDNVKISPKTELAVYLKDEIKQKYDTQLPPALKSQLASFKQVIEAAGNIYLDQNPGEAYSLLAQLPIPIYITTNQHNILQTALKKIGKEPKVILCPWNDEIIKNRRFEVEGNYTPDEDHPLIFHLFGNFENPYSIVLTEDDYFKYLIGVVKNWAHIPLYLQGALVSNSLLFLGFQVDDWDFRIILRSFLSTGGADLIKSNPHVAAQIQPEEGRFIEPERASRVLGKYLNTSASLSLFWGSVDDFLQQLWQQINQ
jgi:hypothetical protein